MKKIIYIVLLLPLLAKGQSANTNNTTQIASEIDSLIGIKLYFQARVHFNNNKEALSDSQYLRLKGTICNLFNKLEESNDAITLLFNKYGDKLTQTEKKDLLNAKLSNAVKLFDYKLADEVTYLLTTDYKNVTTESELESTLNNGKIWKALSNYPKQTITIKSDSKFKLIPDKAGLKNLTVVSNENQYPFIFDTGANISTIVHSQAVKMGLDIIDIAISVGTITGKRVNAKVGIASKLSIGNMYFTNVVFLVFPDEALYIPQIDYQINGILGYPVLSAMKEVHFINTDELFVPKKSEIEKDINLAIEYLTPIINLTDEVGNEMSFTFDTGADQTMLYKSYYDLKKKDILNNYSKTKIRFGGAGGNTEVDGYHIGFKAKINDEIISLESVDLIPELIKPNDRYSFGNIGQDLISKFNKMVINFEKMFIHFSK